jgi:methyltransferase (TIGR00027 family)
MGAIKNVSDTALWVAVHRAMEGLRPDAIYHDPLSLKLAGERGQQIAQKMSGGNFMTWMMAMRTVAIDRFITSAVNDGVTRIVNLGAGLDTRPYRIELPPSIKWIEVDFPEIISQKNKILETDAPHFNLIRWATDLTDPGDRNKFFSQLRESNEPTVVLTEGVLPYLENADVIGLANSLREISSLKYWIHDYREGGYATGIPKIWMKWRMRNAPMKFIVDDWFAFFDTLGWKVKTSTNLKEESQRHGRAIGRPDWLGALSFLIPIERMEHYSRQLGVVMLEKS